MVKEEDLMVGDKFIINKSHEFSDWSWGYEIELISNNGSYMGVKLIDKHGNNLNPSIRDGISWSWSKTKENLNALSFTKERTVAEKLFL